MHGSTLSKGIQTALDERGLLPTSLVPEVDKSISSCSRDIGTLWVIHPLETRDLVIHVFDDTVGEHIKRRRIQKSE